MSYLFITTIVFASLLEYLGDSNFKFYARNDDPKNLLYGSISYVAMVFVLIQILKRSNVMYMNMYWDAVSIILETVLAYFVLGERLDNNYQGFGFILIVVGVLLLNFGEIPK